VASGHTLGWLAAGDWAVFPPMEDYIFFHTACRTLQMWDSPPAEGQDHKPQIIETMVWPNSGWRKKLVVRQEDEASGMWVPR